MTMTALPSLRLDGKRALVTGAGRGIGLAIAQVLSQAGADVVLCARTGREVDVAAQTLKTDGFKATSLSLDVTQIAEVEAYIDSSAPFDVFINNAGMNRPKPLIDITEDDYDAVVGLNVKAAIFAARSISKRLISAGRPGSIVNMSSQMGLVGAANRTIYCASKWAIEGFSKALAVELGSHEIRVNTLCPTFVETPMTRPFFEDQNFRDSVMSKTALGRFGTVGDVAGAALFLASDASALMTGSSLVVDGGWTAQ